MGILSLLAGCSRPTLKTRLNRAVEDVAPVSSSELTFGGGGGLRSQLLGRIHLDVEEGELEAAFDEAWRVTITVLHQEDEEAQSREIQGVRGIGADGSEFSPQSWVDMDGYQALTVGRFYERYGLS